MAWVLTEPCIRKKQPNNRVGGWEKLKQEATPSTQSSKAASLLRFSVQIKSLRASISSPKRSPSYRLTYNHNQIPNDITIALAICISDPLFLIHRYQPESTETGSGSAPLLSAYTLTIRLKRNPSIGRSDTKAPVTSDTRFTLNTPLM